MTKDILSIGIPSKGRLRKDILKIFKKNKLDLISERGERDLLGSIQQLKSIKVLYLQGVLKQTQKALRQSDDNILGIGPDSPDGSFENKESKCSTDSNSRLPIVFWGVPPIAI